MSYQPGLTSSTRLCDLCGQKFITREGSERTVCLKCAHKYPEKLSEDQRTEIFTSLWR